VQKTQRLPWVLASILAVAVVVSNGWWLYWSIDQAVTAKYADQMQYECTHSLAASLNLAQALAEGLERHEVVDRVERAFPAEDPFEKDGLWVVGWLVFKFSDDGRLIEITTV
jgi:Tfp pilus assembly protein PilO